MSPVRARPSTTPLLLSLSETAAVHVLSALIDHRRTCRLQHLAYPIELDQIAAQLSGRLIRGQECSTLDAAAPAQHAEHVEPTLLTYAVAAQMLAVSVPTLRRRVAEGVLTPVRHGRTVRLRRTDLEHLIEGEIS